MEFEFQTKYEFNQRRRKRKQKKEKEKKKKLLGPPARSSRPAQLAWPAQQVAQRASPTPARLPVFPCCRCHLAPHVSRTPATVSSSPHASTAARSEADSNGRGGLWGHARGTALSPWRRAHATMRAPLHASTRLRSPLIPIRRSPSSAVPRSAIKPRPLVP